MAEADNNAAAVIISSAAAPALSIANTRFSLSSLGNRQSDMYLYVFFVSFAEYRDEKALDHATSVVVDALIQPPSHHPQSFPGLAPTYFFTRVFNQRLRL